MSALIRELQRQLRSAPHRPIDEQLRRMLKDHTCDICGSAYRLEVGTDARGITHLTLTCSFSLCTTATTISLPMEVVHAGEFGTEAVPSALWHFFEAFLSKHETAAADVRQRLEVARDRLEERGDDRGRMLTVLLEPRKFLPGNRPKEALEAEDPDARAARTQDLLRLQSAVNGGWDPFSMLKELGL
jgi:hypothetical protein